MKVVKKVLSIFGIIAIAVICLSPLAFLGWMYYAQQQEEALITYQTSDSYLYDTHFAVKSQACGSSSYVVINPNQAVFSLGGKLLGKSLESKNDQYGFTVHKDVTFGDDASELFLNYDQTGPVVVYLSHATSCVRLATTDDGVSYAIHTLRQKKEINSISSWLSGSYDCGTIDDLLSHVQHSVKSNCYPNSGDQLRFFSQTRDSHQNAVNDCGSVDAQKWVVLKPHNTYFILGGELYSSDGYVNDLLYTLTIVYNPSSKAESFCYIPDSSQKQKDFSVSSASAAQAAYNQIQTENKKEYGGAQASLYVCNPPITGDPSASGLISDNSTCF